MNKFPENKMDSDTLFLAGIRDNLLKPMAEEICAKTERQIRSLRTLLLLGIGAALLSILADAVVVIVLLIRK